MRVNHDLISVSVLEKWTAASMKGGRREESLASQEEDPLSSSFTVRVTDSFPQALLLSLPTKPKHREWGLKREEDSVTKRASS